MKTLGLSPKVWAPVALQILGLLVNWIASGAFDRVEIAQAVAAVGTAIVGYLAAPGSVTAPAFDPAAGDVRRPAKA